MPTENAADDFASIAKRRKEIQADKLLAQSRTAEPAAPVAQQPINPLFSPAGSRTVRSLITRRGAEMAIKVDGKPLTRECNLFGDSVALMKSLGQTTGEWNDSRCNQLQTKEGSNAPSDSFHPRRR